MRRRISATVALSVLLVLAGCLGGVGGVGGEMGPSTTATPTPPQTQPSAGGGDASTPTATPDSGTPTQTYVAAKPPNRPTQTATRKAAGNRIINAKFVNTEKSSDGSGYSHFDIRMLANTSMEGIDPPAHGDAEGEPYAIVLINGKLVERTSYLEMRDRGRYTIDVRMAGFEHNDIKPGKLNVKVLLMDQDSAHGDVYGSWSGTIQYAK